MLTKAEGNVATYSSELPKYLTDLFDPLTKSSLKYYRGQKVLATAKRVVGMEKIHPISFQSPKTNAGVHPLDATEVFDICRTKV